MWVYNCTGEVVNILQSLAGDDYIEKSHLELLKKLGEGGFAVVEKALLSVPGKEPEVVAIKTLKPGLIKDEEDLHELIQEANVLRKLKHRLFSFSCQLVREGRLAGYIVFYFYN